jgi:hypothetical protein
MSLTEHDDILSEILDGLIEFQEKSPIGPVVGPSFEPESHISSIEKYLASSTPDPLLFAQPKPAPPPASSSTLSSLLSAPPISVPTVNPPRPSGNFNIMGQVMITNSPGPRQTPSTTTSAASMVPRMNELLQVVPPNVSVTDAPPDHLVSML